jgi:hypothetical protein
VYKASITPLQPTRNTVQGKFESFGSFKLDPQTEWGSIGCIIWDMEPSADPDDVFRSSSVAMLR